MAELSSLLFSVGTILVALGFAAHVGHAVMLANGDATSGAGVSGRTLSTARGRAAMTWSSVSSMVRPSNARRPASSS